MSIFMQLVLGLGIFLMVGSAYYVLSADVVPLWKKIIFCLYAAALVFVIYRKTKK